MPLSYRPDGPVTVRPTLQSGISPGVLPAPEASPIAGISSANLENRLRTATNWANPPSLRELKQNLKDAESAHQKHVQNVDRWLEALRCEGEFSPPKLKGRSSVQPKLVRKQAEWRKSSLARPFLSSPDLFDVNPLSANDRNRAMQNALLLNQQFTSAIDRNRLVDLAVAECVETGTAIFEVSWVAEEEWVEEDVPVFEFVPDESLQETLQALSALKQESRDRYFEQVDEETDAAVTEFAQTGIPVRAILTGRRTEGRMQETKNQPSVTVADIHDVIIDPSSKGDLSSARFVVKRFAASLSTLKKDRRYKNLEALSLPGEGDPSLFSPDWDEGPDNEGFAFSDEARKTHVVHTYWGDWDIRGDGTTVAIVCSWIGNLMIRLEENPYPFKRPPFAIANYMPRRNSVYGEPDAELLGDNQKITGALTRGVIDLLGRSANSQTGYRTGFLNAVNRRRFEEGADYEFTNGDPREAVYQHQYPEIPQSVLQMLDLQQMEAESLTGVKGFSHGIHSTSIGDSVQGGRDALDAAGKRESDILRRLAAAFREVGRMVMAMNAEWLSEEEVVRVTDTAFVQVRRDDLAGHFDLTLSISTAEEDQAKVERLSFVFQTVGNNLEMPLQQMILADMMRIQKMPDLARKIEEYRPEPDPMAVRQMELQLQLLEAQAEKERAIAARNLAEAAAAEGKDHRDASQGELNLAKVEETREKARNIAADTDLKDQEYLMEHSGERQARELELQQARRRPNP